MPKGLAYQWSEEYQTAERKTKKQKLMKQASELLHTKNFPDKLLSRKNLRLVTLIHSTGWRDYDYVIESAQTFQSYWEKCGGEFVLPQQ